MLEGVLINLPGQVPGPPHGRVQSGMELLPPAALHHMQRRLDRQDMGQDQQQKVRLFFTSMQHLLKANHIYISEIQVNIYVSFDK